MYMSQHAMKLALSYFGFFLKFILAASKDNGSLEVKEQYGDLKAINMCRNLCVEPMRRPSSLY